MRSKPNLPVSSALSERSLLVHHKRPRGLEGGEPVRRLENGEDGHLEFYVNLGLNCVGEGLHYQHLLDIRRVDPRHTDLQPYLFVLAVIVQVNRAGLNRGGRCRLGANKLVELLGGSEDVGLRRTVERNNNFV